MATAPHRSTSLTRLKLLIPLTVCGTLREVNRLARDLNLLWFVKYETNSGAINVFETLVSWYDPKTSPLILSWIKTAVPSRSTKNCSELAQVGPAAMTVAEETVKKCTKKRDAREKLFFAC